MVMSIDLGLASGASLWEYSEIKPARMVEGWEITGGYEGLRDWLEIHQHSKATWIAEKWIPYPTKGHSPTLESTYPLVLEGVLIDRGLLQQYPAREWRRSSEQYWVKGRNAVEKRAKQKAWLKSSTDLYRTAGQLGARHKDSEDYLSSVFHALAWFRKFHRPTIEHYWKDEA